MSGWLSSEYYPFEGTYKLIQSNCELNPFKLAKNRKKIWDAIVVIMLTDLKIVRHTQVF